MSGTSNRPITCVVCSALVNVASVTTTDPGAPEFLQAPLGAWIGFVAGDTAPELIAVCGGGCLHRLLEGGG